MDISEFKSTFIDTIDANVAQYPCIKENKKVYLSDGRVIRTYTGENPCYVTPLDNSRTSIGKVGGVPDTGQWKMNGNILLSKSSSSSKTFYSVLSVVKGKLQATQIDTLSYPPYTYYDTFVNIKQ